jgi:elongation factor G
LRDLKQKDSAMRIETEPAGGEIIVSGMGELHLEIICDRIRREHKIQFDVGKVRIIYLETIRKALA